MENSEKLLQEMKEELKKYDEKTFKVLFFVVDTKGIPNGSLTYIYTTAYKLKEMGYNVQMLHTEKEFVGVGDWLGEKYTKLPHYNVEKDNVSISPSDFLFIPEIYSTVLTKTKELPCKRILLLQKVNYLTETMPMGVNFDDLKIRDCITTTETLEEFVKTYFPDMKTYIVQPSINDEFYESKNEPKKLVINILGKNENDVNTILKTFYWKYPSYKWISFRNIADIPHNELVDLFEESPITVWIDTDTDFGYTALEAMTKGNIIIGKVPKNPSKWIMDKGLLKDNGLWFFDARNACDLICTAIQTYLHSRVPSVIYDNMKKTVSEYTTDKQNKQIEDVYVNKIFETRKNEISAMISIIENNISKKSENNE